jgi:hypothetical protein
MNCPITGGFRLWSAGLFEGISVFRMVFPAGERAMTVDFLSVCRGRCYPDGIVAEGNLP